MWRLNHLHSKFKHPALSKFHVLPNSDPFGRPIILLKVADLMDLSDMARDMFIPTMEVLRCHLQQLNDDRMFFGESQPLLQYVVILDVAGLSIRSIVSPLVAAIQSSGRLFI
jgi:retinaldehyde-binding protein 1